MSKTYEAIYEDGHLEWLGEQPGTGRHRLLVTVIKNHHRDTPFKTCTTC